ncbi:putative oxidase (copper-binding protein) [Sinomonas cellulolyticus]|uniref:Multicopper oxidase family protein n=1 Tax=Sinomonas cellulolyticus TaxID=2801916 RepID=A0ABS1K720_9MICC|nr:MULTISPECIES: multicopper oxidase family protein [Sinomonas]MBL0707319.1 multicopper oxidase family protein [Sinomonas cellulolyticus]GHG50642.1 putative oxidase (copper-binding protein) [Sinomonas sp. KCTC 49339]
MNSLTAQGLPRRTFLGVTLGAASAALLAACSTPSDGSAPSAVRRVMSTDEAVRAAEAARPSSGRTVSASLRAAPLTANLAGKPVQTWGYNDAINGSLLRGSVGDRLEVALENALPEPTVVHWHGLALANDQDGVEMLTQKDVAAGGSFSYGFRLAHPGTYWYHSHVELQRERGLYGPLVVDDPSETKDWDHEWVIVLDDWMDGVTGTPEDVLKELSGGMGGGMSGGMGGMQHSGTYMAMGSMSDFLGGDAGDVRYPLHLFNGRTPEDPDTVTAKPGDRVRLRLINAGGDTAYRVGAPGLKLTVTHTDGYPVERKDVDAVVLGMGERIDALLTVPAGWTPLMARPEGKAGLALGRISTGSGKEPDPAALPARLGGMVVDGGQLSSASTVRLASRSVDVKHTVRLTGSMMAYDWGLNGRRFDMANPYEGALEVRQGQRVQIDFVNEGMMWHPMHVHGHTFQVGDAGARKDTVIVRPGRTVSVFLDADNPGQWLYHCHNAYHAARGMMGVLSYVA